MEHAQTISVVYPTLLFSIEPTYLSGFFLSPSSYTTIPVLEQNIWKQKLILLDKLISKGEIKWTIHHPKHPHGTPHNHHTAAVPFKTNQ